VPWNLPRVVPREGFVVAGHHFKEGVRLVDLYGGLLAHYHQAILSVNPWLIHRNPDCFGNDAESYNPDRWLGDAEQVRQMEKFLIPVVALFRTVRSFSHIIKCLLTTNVVWARLQRLSWP